MPARIRDVLSRNDLLEPLLIAGVLLVTACMWWGSVDTPVLLHLYYVPVVVAGSSLGRYRARVMAVLCILSSLVMFLPNLYEQSSGTIPMITLLAFLLWAATLVLIAVLVGTLSDGWRGSLAELAEAHRRDALTDSLTEVFNRHGLEVELASRTAIPTQDETTDALLMLDIDYFKKFNDRYGHHAGDAVLRSVAALLKGTVRESDVVARYGGEEFCVLLSHASVDAAKVIAENIRTRVEAARFPFNGMTLRLTVSIGLARVRANEDCTDALQRADAALYSAKEAGRNCVIYHDGVRCHRFGEGLAMGPSTKARDEQTSRDAAEPCLDETTGLPTQSVFLHELRRRSAERDRYGSRLSLAIVACGVDAAQQPADGGRRTEDQQLRKALLATTAKLASSMLRDTDLIARYESNSLSVLLPATNLEHALVPLRRLREVAANYADARYAELKYEVSIGAAESLPEEHPGSALQRVEAALASAVSRGGNCVCIHDGVECQRADNDECSTTIEATATSEVETGA